MRRPKTDCPTTRPDKQALFRRGGEAVSELTVHLNVVTPILGGAARTREIDEVDILRVPTVRGHLRFWWRALHAYEYRTSQSP